MKRYSPTIFRRLIYLSLTLSLVALGLSGLFFLKKKQIVYVDTMKLVNQYKGTIQAKAAYHKKVAIWKANVDTLTRVLNDQIIQYEKVKKDLSASEKKITEQLIETKRLQLENDKSAMSENTFKEDQAVTAQVVGEIDDFLNKYGEDHGYEFILGPTNASNVVYGKGKNITDEVLKALNGEYRPSKK